MRSGFCWSEGWDDGFTTPIPSGIRSCNSTCFAYHAAQQLLSRSLPSRWRHHLPFPLLGCRCVLSLASERTARQPRFYSRPVKPKSKKGKLQQLSFVRQSSCDKYIPKHPTGRFAALHKGWNWPCVQSGNDLKSSTVLPLLQNVSTGKNILLKRFPVKNLFGSSSSWSFQLKCSLVY